MTAESAGKIYLKKLEEKSAIFSPRTRPENGNVKFQLRNFGVKETGSILKVLNKKMK